MKREAIEMACVGAGLKSELTVELMLKALGEVTTPSGEARLLSLTKNMLMAYSAFHNAAVDMLSEQRRLLQGTLGE